jgi:hypothetical protein
VLIFFIDGLGVGVVDASGSASMLPFAYLFNVKLNSSDFAPASEIWNR